MQVNAFCRAKWGAGLHTFAARVGSYVRTYVLVVMVFWCGVACAMLRRTSAAVCFTVMHLFSPTDRVLDLY